MVVTHFWSTCLIMSKMNTEVHIWKKIIYSANWHKQSYTHFWNYLKITSVVFEDHFTKHLIGLILRALYKMYFHIFSLKWGGGRGKGKICFFFWSNQPKVHLLWLKKKISPECQLVKVPSKQFGSKVHMKSLKLGKLCKETNKNTYFARLKSINVPIQQLTVNL